MRFPGWGLRAGAEIESSESLGRPDRKRCIVATRAGQRGKGGGG